jgi:hypothetical protein
MKGRNKMAKFCVNIPDYYFVDAEDESEAEEIAWKLFELSLKGSAPARPRVANVQKLEDGSNQETDNHYLAEKPVPIVPIEDAKDAFRISSEEGIRCDLLPHLVMICEDEDCRHCTLGANSFLAEKWVDRLEESDEDDEDEIEFTPEPFNRESHAREMEKIKQEMLKIIPAKKWTQLMIESYCNEHQHPR